MSFGRFERSGAAQPMSEINVTPLVDVMLVLVVIFIITAPLLASSIRLDLPRSDAAKAASSAVPTVLVVDKTGQVYVSDQPMNLSELTRELRRVAGNDPDTEVQLRADASVPYGRIVEVMGATQSAGLNRIGFVADTATPMAATAKP